MLFGHDMGESVSAILQESDLVRTIRIRARCRGRSHKQTQNCSANATNACEYALSATPARAARLGRLGDGVVVSVAVRASVAVAVGSLVEVAARVRVAVRVGVGAATGVVVRVAVRDAVGVSALVADGVTAEVLVRVAVAGRRVALRVAVTVGVSVAVGVTACAAPILPASGDSPTIWGARGMNEGRGLSVALAGKEVSAHSKRTTQSMTAMNHNRRSSVMATSRGCRLHCAFTLPEQLPPKQNTRRQRQKTLPDRCHTHRPKKCISGQRRNCPAKEYQNRREQKKQVSRLGSWPQFAEQSELYCLHYSRVVQKRKSILRQKPNPVGTPIKAWYNAG